jgi:3-oxoacyl-[acyl-carrier-protein] synthase II
MKLNVYINGVSSISIQQPLSDVGVFTPISYDSPHVRCIEPNFKEFIDPMVSRRMSKIIKRAIVTAKKALEDAAIEIPDAIITGTGLGCVEDTEKFLVAMINNHEQFIQPTYFIQSTHNTISSQIAINLKCNGYNNTYIHRGVSFENALMDALLLLKKDEISSALVTGNDEMTAGYFTLLGRLGYWKDKIENTLAIVQESKSKGSFAGEGSISLVLTNSVSENAYAKIIGFDLMYKPKDITSLIKTFLNDNELDLDDIDLILSGMNGDMSNDEVYMKSYNGLFDESKIGFFKNVCGEFYTSMSYGLMVASQCIKNEIIPNHFTLKSTTIKQPKYILLHNHFQNKSHSLILVSKC